MLQALLGCSVAALAQGNCKQAAADAKEAQRLKAGAVLLEGWTHMCRLSASMAPCTACPPHSVVARCCGALTHVQAVHALRYCRHMAHFDGMLLGKLLVHLACAGMGSCGTCSSKRCAC